MTEATKPSPESQKMLEVLQQAVAEALDKKQRLGQYAVVWQDGAPVMVGGDTANAGHPHLQGESTAGPVAA